MDRDYSLSGIMVDLIGWNIGLKFYPDYFLLEIDYSISNLKVFYILVSRFRS